MQRFPLILPEYPEHRENGLTALFLKMPVSQLHVSRRLCLPVFDPDLTGQPGTPTMK